MQEKQRPYTIKKEYAVMGCDKKTQKRLALISWDGAPARLNLREFYKDGDELRTGRGVHITREEAAQIIEGLQAYLADTETE